MWRRMPSSSYSATESGGDEIGSLAAPMVFADRRASSTPPESSSTDSVSSRIASGRTRPRQRTNAGRGVRDERRSRSVAEDDARGSAIRRDLRRISRGCRSHLARAHARVAVYLRADRRRATPPLDDRGPRFATQLLLDWTQPRSSSGAGRNSGTAHGVPPSHAGFRPCVCRLRAGSRSIASAGSGSYRRVAFMAWRRGVSCTEDP